MPQNAPDLNNALDHDPARVLDQTDAPHGLVAKTTRVIEKIALFQIVRAA
jgi:hypothetical protein